MSEHSVMYSSQFKIRYKTQNNASDRTSEIGADE